MTVTHCDRCTADMTSDSAGWHVYLPAKAGEEEQCCDLCASCYRGLADLCRNFVERLQEVAR